MNRNVTLNIYTNETSDNIIYRKEKLKILLKGSTETYRNEISEQRRGFLNSSFFTW